jgi:hypothetical protein
MVDGESQDWRWKRPKLPSIFMPREACRLILDINAIKPERVQDISEEDVETEGLQYHSFVGACRFWSNTQNQFCSARDAFKELWDSMYAKTDRRWENNPWNWAYSFRKEQTLQQFILACEERIRGLSPEEIKAEYDKALAKAEEESRRLMEARIVDKESLHKPMTI